MPVHAFLENKAAKTERALLERLERLEGAPATLREAMAYSLMAGGKRLRPALCLGAAELVSGDDAPALPAACALEMIHTYSLIHDDLPSMDDDDLRRGKPTSHKVYGEAIAILAGDALLTLAFETAAESGRPDVVAEIARAAGAEGMVGGQVIDLESEEKRLAVTQLRRLHACKTGALIRASVRCGAMLGGADAAQFEALTRFGEHIGLAFQIADDILDVVGTAETLGKAVGADAAHGKSTYPSVVGLERARGLADETVAAAVGALEGFGPEADVFRALAHFIVERES
jgi:geranylgeranyl diphosphate synthase type II